MRSIQKVTFVEKLGTTLNTREAAEEVLNSVDSRNAITLELDFSHVEFVSRSFADELHKRVASLSSRLDLKLVVLNASKEILDVLSAVEKTQSKTERKKSQFQNVKLTSQEDISRYLQAL